MNDFEHNGAHVSRQRRGKGRGVVVFAVFEAGGKREEIVVEYLLPGCGKRGHGSAVERAVKRDDGASALAVFVKRIFAGKLNGTFVGLRAGIAEKDLAKHSAFGKLFGKQCRRFAVKIVGHMLNLAKLCRDRRDIAAVGRAKRQRSDAACKVDILFVVGGKECGVFAVIDHDVIPPIRIHDIIRVKLFDIGRVHKVPPYSYSIIIVPIPSLESISIRIE